MVSTGPYKPGATGGTCPTHFLGQTSTKFYRNLSICKLHSNNSQSTYRRSPRRSILLVPSTIVLLMANTRETSSVFIKVCLFFMVQCFCVCTQLLDLVQTSTIAIVPY